MTTYNFVCPQCGFTWENTSFNDYQCPNCDFNGSVCTYNDGYGTVVGREQYDLILDNLQHGYYYSFTCEDCGNTYRMLDGAHCRCHCGGLLHLEKTPVGGLLRDYRKRKGMTQTTLAKRLDISRTLLSALETGNRVATGSLESAIKRLVKV